MGILVKVQGQLVASSLQVAEQRIFRLDQFARERSLRLDGQLAAVTFRDLRQRLQVGHVPQKESFPFVAGAGRDAANNRLGARRTWCRGRVAGRRPRQRADRRAQRFDVDANAKQERGIRGAGILGQTLL